MSLTYPGPDVESENGCGFAPMGKKCPIIKNPGIHIFPYWNSHTLAESIMGQNGEEKLKFEAFNPEEAASPDIQSTVIHEEENPYGSLIASLESDGRTIYFYLNPTVDPSFQPRAVWVRNLVPAPEMTDTESMKQGIAPRFRKSLCKHPEGLPAIRAEEVEFIWFEDGVGVALMINGEMEALIPPWSGAEGLLGYSKQALGKEVGTIPFPADDQILKTRVEESRIFWDSRSDMKYWDTFRDQMLFHYESTYGPHTRYFAIQSQRLPVGAVAEFKLPDGDYIYATLGMSLQNMPGIEAAMKDPAKYFRIEIITRRGDCPEWLPDALGNMVLHPWRANNFLAHGHSFESKYSVYDRGTFLLTSIYSDEMIPRPASVEQDGLPVTFLYAIPLGTGEIADLKTKGNGPFLRSFLRENGIEPPTN